MAATVGHDAVGGLWRSVSAPWPGACRTTPVATSGGCDCAGRRLASGHPPSAHRAVDGDQPCSAAGGRFGGLIPAVSPAARTMGRPGRASDPLGRSAVVLRRPVAVPPAWRGTSFRRRPYALAGGGRNPQQCSSRTARATQWLAEHKVQGRLLTQYGWGQYVLWHLYPDCTVGFDGRYRTIYPAEIETQFLAFQKLKPGDEPPPLLDQAEIILWPVEHRPLPYLAGRPEWVEVYRDDQASVWLRDQPAWAAILGDRTSLPETSSDQRRWLRFPGGPQNGIPVATSRNR